MQKTMQKERRFADQILTDNGQLIRISTASANRTVTIGGRKVRIKDIPYAVFTMECGHIARGIAVQTGDLVFCEKCHSQRHITSTRSS